MVKSKPTERAKRRHSSWETSDIKSINGFHFKGITKENTADSRMEHSGDKRMDAFKQVCHPAALWSRHTQP